MLSSFCSSHPLPDLSPPSPVNVSLPFYLPSNAFAKKKKNCQTLLVTKRDNEAEKREPEMFFDEAEIPAFPFSRLCL